MVVAEMVAVASVSSSDLAKPWHTGHSLSEQQIIEVLVISTKT